MKILLPLLFLLSTTPIIFGLANTKQFNPTVSPTPTPVSTPKPTAKCKDGTYSYSQSRQGTCSHHGGVAEWY